VLIVGRSLSPEFIVEVVLQPETANPADISTTPNTLLLTNLLAMLNLLFAEFILPCLEGNEITSWHIFPAATIIRGERGCVKVSPAWAAAFFAAGVCPQPET